MLPPRDEVSLERPFFTSEALGEAEKRERECVPNSSAHSGLLRFQQSLEEEAGPADTFHQTPESVLSQDSQAEAPGPTGSP